MQDIINNNFDEFDKPRCVHLTEWHTFLAIWTKPQIAFESIISKKIQKIALLYFMLPALSLFVNFGFETYDDRYKLIYVITQFIGPFIILPILVQFFLTITLFIGGKLLRGKASYANLLKVGIYSTIPNILYIIPIIVIIFFDNSFYKFSFNTTIYYKVIKIIFMILYYFVPLYNFFLIFIGIKIAQQFSYLKAFFNVMILFIILFICLLVMY